MGGRGKEEEERDDNFKIKFKNRRQENTKIKNIDDEKYGSDTR